MFVEVRLRSGANWVNYSIITRFKELSFDMKYLDAGGISLSVPTLDAAAIGLADLSVIEVAPNGVSVDDGWYYIDGTSGTKVSDDELWTTFSGKSLIALIDEARVYPQNWAPSINNPTSAQVIAAVVNSLVQATSGVYRKRDTNSWWRSNSTVLFTDAQVFADAPSWLQAGVQPAGHSFGDIAPATAGTILQTLISKAQARGTITWLDASTFTGTTTSNSTPWGSTVALFYDNGTGLFAVLQDLASRGMISWRMTGRQLKVYNLDEMVVHRTPEVATFRRGQSVVDQSKNTDSSSWASAVLVVGDQNQAVERLSATNLAGTGRRREIYIAQSGITDIPTLQMIGDRTLSTQHLRSEDTIGTTDVTGPWTNYNAGDWVWEDMDGVLVNLQVQQIAASELSEAVLKIGLTLGDMLDQQDAKVARQLASITNGGGAIPSPVVNTGSVPNAPTGVTAAATAYRDVNGIDHDQVTLSWLAPSLNTDGTALTDLDHYDVQWTEAATWSATQTVPAGTLVGYFSNIAPGQTVTFRVRSVDQAGSASSWAQSSGVVMPKVLTTPATPSTPITSGSIRALVVQWNGLDNTGTAYPSSWDRTDIHASTVSGFTPGVSNLQDSFSSRVSGAGVVGARKLISVADTSIWYVKLIAYDKSGNASAASAQSAGVSAVLIATADLADKLVTGAKIGDAAISTAQLTVAAFGQTAIGNGSMETPWTALEDSSSGLAHWKLTAWSHGTPTVTRDTTTFAGGTSSMKIHVPDGADHYAQVVDSAGGGPSAGFPITGGGTWFVRFKCKASRAGVTGVQVAMNCADSPANSLVLFDANNPWVPFLGSPTPTPGVDALGLATDPFPGVILLFDTEWHTVEGSLVVPAGLANPLVLGRLILQNTQTSDALACDIWIDGVELLPVHGSAYIADASIGAAKIVDINAEAIKVGNLTAVDISAGTMSAGFVSDAEMGGCDFVIDDKGGQLLVYLISGQQSLSLNSDAPGAGSFVNTGAGGTPGTGLVKVECWGAGGGGESAQAGYGGGAGGAGGEYAREDAVSMTAGNSYPFQIGAGGAGTTWPGNDAGEGQPSYFTGDAGKLVYAHGGTGAFGGYQVSGASGSTNGAHFNGGANNVGGTTFHRAGNSGGSGAGSSQSGFAGKAANGNTLAPAVQGPPITPTGGLNSDGIAYAGRGGAGGSGRTSGAGWTAGAVGGWPGGGGGGGGGNGSTGTGNNGAGNVGGKGRIRLSWGGTRVLVASIAAAAGNDAFGNAYPAGMRITQQGSGNDTAFHLVGATGEPVFQNSWVNYGGATHQVAGFYKDALGIVHVFGLVKSGTAGSVIFTLPAGYRPNWTHIFNANSNNAGACRLDITVTGQVIQGSYSGAGSNVYVSLAGITFMAEV